MYAQGLYKHLHLNMLVRVIFICTHFEKTYWQHLETIPACVHVFIIFDAYLIFHKLKIILTML